MVAERVGEQGLTEASRNNFTLGRFFVTADDQIKIVGSDGVDTWVIRVVNCTPLIVGVNELKDGEVSRISRPTDLVPGEAYQVGGKNIYIATTSRVRRGQRMLKMTGPEGTKFEKVE